MGSMILCRSKEAKNPLKIHHAGISIYTVEELCYYIYNNIYLIGNDFINDNLIVFLKDEVEETQLAERIEFLREKNAGLAEIVVTILKSVDYYSMAEIEQIREILNTLNSQNMYERLKTRGDSYLYNHCFYNAIKCYMQIIDEYKGNELSGIFLAGVFHNAGVAFARMFLYKEASQCFKTAYKIGQHEESKKCYMAADWFAERNEGPVNEDVSEDEYVLRREIETLMDNARYQDEYRELEDIDSLKADGNVAAYHKAIEEVIERWKKSYFKYTDGSK